MVILECCVCKQSEIVVCIVPLLSPNTLANLTSSRQLAILTGHVTWNMRHIGSSELCE